MRCWPRFTKAAELRSRVRAGLPGPDGLQPTARALQGHQARRDLAPKTQKTHETSLHAFHTFFVRQGGDPDAHEIRRGAISAFLTWRRRHAPDGTPLATPQAYSHLVDDDLLSLVEPLRLQL